MIRLLILLLLAGPALAQTSPEVIAYRAADAALTALVTAPNPPDQIIMYRPGIGWTISVTTRTDPANVIAETLSLFSNGGVTEAMSHAAMMGYRPTHGIDYATGKLFVLVPVNVPRIPDALVDFLHERIHQNGPITWPAVEAFAPLDPLDPIIESPVGEQMEAPAPTVAPQ